MRASTILPLVLAAAGIAPALARPFGNAQASTSSSTSTPVAGAPGTAPGVSEPHLPDAHGTHRKIGEHKGEPKYHPGTHAHEQHAGHYIHGAHDHPGQHRGPYGSHRHRHAGQRRPAGPRPMRNRQHLGKTKPEQAVAHKHDTSIHPTVGASTQDRHPGTTPVTEPRAFDEDELFTRELDEELLARSLADELIARKFNVGRFFDDAVKVIAREDEDLFARDDEEEFVARGMFFDDLD